MVLEETGVPGGLRKKLYLFLMVRGVQQCRQY